MRDDRFQRLLIDNGVHFHRPAPEEADDYFSIFMIHQNRCVRARLLAGP
jgi:hypothetical protein